MGWWRKALGAWRCPRRARAGQNISRHQCQIQSLIAHDAFNDRCADQIIAHKGAPARDGQPPGFHRGEPSTLIGDILKKTGATAANG